MAIRVLYDSCVKSLRPSRHAGVLLYFVDGVLPMLRSFFANFFSPPKEGEGRDFQLKVTESLLSNLLVSGVFLVCACQG